MRFSFCTVAFRHDHLTLPEMIEQVAAAGYDGVEIWGNHLPHQLKDLSDVERAREALDRTGVECPMVAPYFDLTSSQAKWDQSIEEAKLQITFAEKLGNKLIRAFTGSRGSADVSIEEWEHAAKGIRLISEHAAARGISVALETHPRTLVDNMSATLSFLEKVDRENVKLNLDIYHFWEVHKDPVAVLNAMYSYVSHVHAKNAHLSIVERETTPHPFLHDKQARQEFPGIVSLKDGDMEYMGFLERLAEFNYQGYVSVEWFGDDPKNALTSELEYLRSATKGADASSASSNAGEGSFPIVE